MPRTGHSIRVAHFAFEAFWLLDGLRRRLGLHCERLAGAVAVGEQPQHAVRLLLAQLPLEADSGRQSFELELRL